MKVTKPKKGDKHNEKPASWYDVHYSKSAEYKKEPEDIFYYPIWKHAVEWIGVEKVIDLGCGTGQFAKLLLKSNKNLIAAFDFSNEAIKIAQKINPDHKDIFKVGNIINPKLYNIAYNTVTCFEVLEHIKNDIGVINNLKPGTKFIFSVPNYDYTSHVRFFRSKQHVIDRYKNLLNFKRVTHYRVSDKNVIFLCKAIKK